MQYTPHYNLNLPEGTDIVNPLVQDNPNYTAIDTALYNNKLRVVGGATHVKTGTNHAITLADSDINQFKFVATGDYATGDTFTVDGVTVTPRIADGSTIPDGAFKINSTVLCVLDGTILNLIGVNGTIDADDVDFDNTGTGLSASKVGAAIVELDARVKVWTGNATFTAGVCNLPLLGVSAGKPVFIQDNKTGFTYGLYFTAITNVDEVKIWCYNADAGAVFTGTRDISVLVIE